MAKNITLTVDEELLDGARILAAKRRTSVNEMVRGFLKREVERETAQAARAEVWGRIFESADSGARKRAGRLAEDKPLFDREEFYEEVMRERRLL